MKKLQTLIIVGILMMSISGYSATLFHGQPTSQWSADQTASALIVSGPCVLHGIVVKTDGTNDVTLTIYDNTSAAGTTKLLPASTVVDGANTPWAAGTTPPALMANGIYVSISVAGGGSASYTVQYDQ